MTVEELIIYCVTHSSYVNLQIKKYLEELIKLRKENEQFKKNASNILQGVTFDIIDDIK